MFAVPTRSNAGRRRRGSVRRLRLPGPRVPGVPYWGAGGEAQPEEWVRLLGVFELRAGVGGCGQTDEDRREGRMRTQPSAQFSSKHGLWLGIIKVCDNAYRTL